MKKSTTELFINKSNKIYNNKYGYSLTEYDENLIGRMTEELNKLNIY